MQGFGRGQRLVDAHPIGDPGRKLGVVAHQVGAPDKGAVASETCSHISTVDGRGSGVFHLPVELVEGPRDGGVVVVGVELEVGLARLVGLDDQEADPVSKLPGHVVVDGRLGDAALFEDLAHGRGESQACMHEPFLDTRLGRRTDVVVGSSAVLDHDEGLDRVVDVDHVRIFGFQEAPAAVARQSLDVARHGEQRLVGHVAMADKSTLKYYPYPS
jgi:hypothetical protein